MSEKDFSSEKKEPVSSGEDVTFATDRTSESDTAISDAESGIVPEILEDLKSIESSAQQAYVFLRKAKDAGVPNEVLEKYFQVAVNRNMDNGNPAYAYRLRSSLGLGTKEVIEQAGISAYTDCMQQEMFGRAQEIADEVFGEESKELAAAISARLKQQEEQDAGWEKYRERERIAEDLAEKEGVCKVLSLDATIADLYDSIEFDFENQVFAEEFGDFDKEVHLAYLELSGTEAASKITVLGFFKKFGYSIEDIESDLPIRFEQIKKP